MANVKRSGILITSWPFREDDFTSLVQYAVRLEETLVLNHLQRVFKSVMSKHPTSQFNRAEDAAHATSAYCSSPAGPPWDCSPKGRFECTPPAARVCPATLFWLMPRRGYQQGRISGREEAEMGADHRRACVEGVLFLAGVPEKETAASLDRRS